MIESAVLADDDDDVLDRRRRIAVVCVALPGRGPSGWRQGSDHHCAERRAAKQAVPPGSRGPQSSTPVFGSHPFPHLIALETEGRYRPYMTPLLTLNDKMVKVALLPRLSQTG